MALRTKELIQQIRPEIDAALAPLAKKYGLQSLTVGNGSYSAGGNFALKLEGVLEGGLTPEAERYKNSAELLGLPPLGTKFSFGGGEYTTVGINTTGTKVICTKAGEERRVLFPLQVVSKYGAKEPAVAS
jgi:hypothetical protein